MSLGSPNVTGVGHNPPIYEVNTKKGQLLSAQRDLGGWAVSGCK